MLRENSSCQAWSYALNHTSFQSLGIHILRVHIVDNDSFPPFPKMTSQMIVCHNGSPTIQVGYSGGHALMFSLTNRNKMRKKIIMTKDRSIDRGHTSAATKN